MEFSTKLLIVMALFTLVVAVDPGLAACPDCEPKLPV